MGSADRKARKRLQNKLREHEIPLIPYVKPEGNGPRIRGAVVREERGKAYRKSIRKMGNRMKAAGQKLSLPDVVKSIQDIDAEQDGK